jgi:hypothetical protein
MRHPRVIGAAHDSTLGRTSARGASTREPDIKADEIARWTLDDLWPRQMTQRWLELLDRLAEPDLADPAEIRH